MLHSTMHLVRDPTYIMCVCVCLHVFICCVVCVCSNNLCNYCSTCVSIGLFYYTLGNLDPHLRSPLKNIHLLCVAKYEFIKKYGIEEVMAPIVEALLELEKVTYTMVSILYST